VIQRVPISDVKSWACDAAQALALTLVTYPGKTCFVIVAFESTCGVEPTVVEVTMAKLLTGSNKWLQQGLLGLFLLALVPAVPLQAQQTESGRKLLHRVEPKYPDDLKRHDIGGVVRLSIEISPQGAVRKVSPIGGNPILVEAAMAAVKQWKYASADSNQTLEVRIDFIPRH
jgi:TonB family protein